MREPFRLGDTLDHFTLEELLGAGGMGEVYRALDTRLHRRVALKVVRADTTDDASSGASGSDGNARILREARAAAAFDHPNAVAIFDVGETHGTTWFAMELIDGRSLRAFVGDKSVPLELRLRWLTDVARALAAAHRRGLVHRDVKPENVMVRDDGVVKVLDFGIARRAHAPLDVTAATTPGALDTITQEGALVGTPLYMAPEQLKGEPLDGRVDQFAWGVLAYEMLAGVMPWDAAALSARRPERNAYRLVAAILALDPEPIERLVPALPLAAARVIGRALAKTPKDRHASMDAIVEALEPLVGGKIESLARASRGSSLPAPVKTDMSASGSLPAPPDAAARAGDAPRSFTRARVRAIAIAAAGSLAVAVAVLLARWRDDTRGQTPPVASQASVATAPSSTAVTDPPLPSSSSAEALGAYRAAMQAFQNGASNAWHDNMVRAVALDPALAAAHLRLAWLLASPSPSAAREHFTTATLLRSALSPHDQALLDAGVAYFQSDPVDVIACGKKLEEASRQFPGDAEILYFLGQFHAELGEFTAAEHTLARAIDADPKFAMAWAFRGVYQAYLDDVDGAYASLARCLDAAPGATLCLHFRANLDELEGNCARIESDARRMIAIDPRGATGYGFLAEAGFALGRGLDATREILRQETERLPAQARREAEIARAIRLAELSGDFAAALDGAHKLEEIAAPGSDEGKHATAAAALVRVLREIGDTKEAARVARAFMSKRAAWMLDPRGEDYAVAADVTPMMLAAQAHGGLLDETEMERRRAEWLRRWKAVLAPAYGFTLWVQGVASLVDTPKDATHALEVLGVYGEPHRFGPLTLARADLGRVQLLAGRAAEAIDSLEGATRTCVALTKPIEHTRAHATLGEALENKGDVARACVAYQVVLERWGKAKPRSVTAERVRRRVRALRCGT